MNNYTDSVEIELSKAIKLLRIAEDTVKDVRLALIRADRSAGPTNFSEDISGHIRQIGELANTHGRCASAISITLSVMRGDGDTDVEIVQGR